LGFGLGLKDHASCLGNQRYCFITLLFKRQQKKKKKKESKQAYSINTLSRRNHHWFCDIVCYV
jgi:hypothetical protein